MTIHSAGTVTVKATKAADEADKKPAEKEVLTDEERKKKNRKDDSRIVIAAGRAFVNRYL